MLREQPADWSLLHTVEEMQRLSNIGHRVEGVLLLTVALIALGEASGIIRAKLLWPGLIVVSGLFLFGFLLLHHGLDKLKLVWTLILKDPQQSQHLIMAGLLIFAGISEIIFRKHGFTALQFVWPLVVFTIGVMFLIHEQHGSSDAVESARRIHKYLGVLMIFVAILILLNSLLAEKYKWIKFGWPILLIVTSIFLFIYKEPEGAFNKENPRHLKNHKSNIN
jgi:hypothetical protein